MAIGRPSGIARAITEAAVAEGAEVTVAGRDAAKLRQAYDENENVHAETADITDDATIRSLAERTGTVDHVVTTASARARGLLRTSTARRCGCPFDTKVIGPVMLARHFAPRINEGGSITLFSGVLPDGVAQPSHNRHFVSD